MCAYIHCIYHIYVYRSIYRADEEMRTKTQKQQTYLYIYYECLVVFSVLYKTKQQQQKTQNKFLKPEKKLLSV